MLVSPGTARPNTPPSTTIPGSSAIVNASPSFSNTTRPKSDCSANERIATTSQKRAKYESRSAPFACTFTASALST